MNDAHSIARAIDALDDAFAAIVERGASLHPWQWNTATTCPGWTVHDHVSHLAGLESRVLGLPQAPHTLPPLAHVVTDIDREIELDVDRRRAVPSAVVLAELRDTYATHVAALRAAPPAPDDTMMHLGGRKVRAERWLRMRVLDTWTHGEDIRRAVGDPPDDRSTAAEIATEVFLAGFESIVEAATPPEGSVIALEITGPFPHTRIVAFDAEPTSAPTTTIRMDVATYTARCAGRIPADDPAIEIVGQRAIGAAVVARLAVTP